MTSSRLDFERLPNTRDLGGMRTKDGRTIRKGRLIRSAQLMDASESDRRRLSEMLDLVLDFRNDLEAEDDPDPKLESVEYIHLPILAQLAPGLSEEENSSGEIILKAARNPEVAIDYMIGLYRQFATSDFAISQYARFLDYLLQDRKGAVLWHCSAGKDRAGFGSVIIERLLGVDESSILEDYLATNVFLHDEALKIMSMIKKEVGIDSPELDKTLASLYEARAEYLNAVDECIREKYGSFDAYAQKALGIDQKKRERLKELYLD